MKRYNMIKPMGLCESEHGEWVRYSDIVNDPGHIPSMQINELARRLESLETSIEKGQIESNKLVFDKFKYHCYHHTTQGTGGNCIMNGCNQECAYNNCPLLKGLQ